MTGAVGGEAGVTASSGSASASSWRYHSPDARFRRVHPPDRPGPGEKADLAGGPPGARDKDPVREPRLPPRHPDLAGAGRPRAEARGQPAGRVLLRAQPALGI